MFGKLSEENIPGFKTAPSDEQELPMGDINTHYNDLLNLRHRLMVQTSGPGSEEKDNGGLINDVRVA